MKIKYLLIKLNYTKHMKYLMIIAYILVSCSTKSTNNSTKNDEQNLIVIDVTKKHPEKIVYAQDIADIEYIPLETNDSTLIDRRKPDVVSEQYIVYHNQNGQVLVFNRQGKRLFSFNRTGGGPEEYDSIDEIVLDEKKKELYITNCELNTKIYVYSIDGTFKRKLDLLTKHAPTCLMNYDKDYLFCYNSYCMDTPDNILIEDDIKKRDNPYFFISKHTGEITPLKYSIPNRIVNRSYHVRKDKSGIQGSFQINIYPLIQNTSNIMITEFADDTLYSLKNKKLYPIMIKKPSAHKMTPPILVGVDLITNRYIFINTVEKNPNEGRLKQTSMVYDKQSADFYQLNLLNKDCSYKRFINMYGSELLHNTGISSMGAEYLLQDYKAGKLQGELKQIASKLKEDDNPILMLIKFKR